jgi:hypothetical protein
MFAVSIGLITHETCSKKRSPQIFPFEKTPQDHAPECKFLPLDRGEEKWYIGLICELLERAKGYGGRESPTCPGGGRKQLAISSEAVRQLLKIFDNTTAIGTWYWVFGEVLAVFTDW